MNKIITFILFIFNNIYYFCSSVIDDKVIARINDNIILKSDLINYKKINNIYKDNFNIIDKNKILNSLIRDIIIYDISLNNNKIIVEDKIIDEFISMEAKNNLLSKKEYINYIKSNNINKDFYISYIKRKISNIFYINKFIKKNINIKEKDIDKYKKYFNINENFIKNAYSKISLNIIKINNLKFNRKLINKIYINLSNNNNYFYKIKNDKKFIKDNNINFITYKDVYINKIPIFIQNIININKNNKVKNIKVCNYNFIVSLYNIKKPNIKLNTKIKKVNCFYIHNYLPNSKKDIFSLFNYIRNKNEININNIKTKYKNINLITKYNRNLLLNNEIKNKIEKLSLKNNVLYPILHDNKWILINLTNLYYMKNIDFYKNIIIKKILYNRKIYKHFSDLIKKNKKFYIIDIL